MPGHSQGLRGCLLRSPLFDFLATGRTVTLNLHFDAVDGEIMLCRQFQEQAGHLPNPEFYEALAA
jgi:hypothetical protein